jgi:hemerythrin
MELQWSEILSVKVKVIDDQHKKFISIVNELFKSFYKMDSRDRLGKIIDQLISYASEHFATEEKYFDEFNYEFSAEHKQQHLELKTRILDIKNKFNKEEEGAIDELLDYVEDWLVNHIQTHDMKYVACFKEHGLS